ncbi:MAG: putative metal-binding motif-containing protein, partial [Chitinophagales bacterium]|nr:putative metal-binding motif-containing protein [Chitinophagales bacterium]
MADFSTDEMIGFAFFGYNALSSMGKMQVTNIVVNGTVDLDDVDGDGYGIAVDCDDSDASVYPGALEICNGIDEDCDGGVDEVGVEITPTGEIVLCRHEEITLSATTGLDSYLWYKNGSAIPTETGSTIVTDKPGYYQVEVTKDLCVGMSEVQAVAVVDNPFANIYYPEGLDLCADDSLKLKVSYGADYSYQWYHDGIEMPFADNYKMVALAAGDYWCTITTYYGCARTTDTLTVYNSGE